MKLILKIFKILDAKEKKTFLKLVILILLVSFIDILGAASILPFIAVLVNPNLIETNIYQNLANHLPLLKTYSCYQSLKVA